MRPGIDRRTLSGMARPDRSTIAGLVARLERRGLVERVRDARDGRRNVLRATGESSRLAARTAHMNRAFLAPLDQAEQRTLPSLIARVAGAAGEPRG